MKILLLGKDGQVGWELQRALAPLGELITLGHAEADFENLDRLRDVVQAAGADAIVNAAAYTAVDKAESETDRARRINAEAVGVLAETAALRKALLIHYSTDYVFDGEKKSPYLEDDATNPLSVYGRTKLEGEQAIRASRCRHLIFRTSWIYAARGSNFAKTMLRLARERDKLHVVADQHGAPTSAELIADITALGLHRVAGTPDSAPLLGTYHLAASGESTWHEYARYVIGLARSKGIALKTGPDDVEPIPTEAYPLPARRPRNSRLDTRKLAAAFDLHLPDWRFHVARMVDELFDRRAI